MAYRGSLLAPIFGTSTTPLFGLRREIDRLFNDVAGGAESSRWMPAIDIRETDTSLAIDVELPGIRPEDVEVNVENGILTLSGEKNAERKEDEKGRYHVIERSYGSFFRSFQLPQGIDESQISAQFRDGVLTVEIPKAALPQPRKIAIAAGTGEVKKPGGREQVSRGTASRPDAPDKMAAKGTDG